MSYDKTKQQEEAFNEALEKLYWHFDALRAKGNISERDLFKGIVRGFAWPLYVIALPDD